MAQLIRRLLAGVLASAAVTGGTMAYTASQPIDGASIFDLDDLAAQLPRDTRFYRQTTWLNWDGTFSAIGEAAPEGFSGQSETVSFDAYDAQGNRIASLSEPDGRLMVGLYEYDAQGNYLGGTVHLDHELMSEVRYSYTFDEQGRELSQTSLYEGELLSTSETSYIPQADGTTRAELVSFDEKGSERSTETNVLDNKNRIIHKELSLGGSVTTADYAYDEQDRLTRSVVESADGTVTENIWTYADAADGSYTCRFENYENGVLRGRTEQQCDGLGIPVYQAEYDAAGNLLLKMTAEPLDL